MGALITSVLLQFYSPNLVIFKDVLNICKMAFGRTGTHTPVAVLLNQGFLTLALWTLWIG